MTSVGKEIIERLARIEEQNKTLFSQIAKLDRAINGNGVPGILDKLSAAETRLKVVEKAQNPSNQSLENRIKQIEDQHDHDEKNHSSKLEWYAIGASILGALYAIFFQKQ